MKHTRFVSVLLSCLLAAAGGTVITAFAADKTGTQTTEQTAAAETTAASTKPAETTTAKATTAAPATTTAAATTTTAATTKATAATTTTAVTTTTASTTTTTAAATTSTTTTTTASTTTTTAQTIPTYRIGLAAKKGTSGIQVNEDGTASCFYEGKKLTGHFNVELDYIKGDINGDGKVDASDAGAILVAAAASATNGVDTDSWLADKYEVIGNAFQGGQIGDVNNDGAVNASDAAAILRYSSRAGVGLQTKPIGQAQYYADQNGVLQHGWIPADGSKLYARDDYSLSEGWEKLGGSTFYFSDSALMQTGYITINENIFYLGQDGSLTTGWLDTRDGVYYFNVSTGAQAFGVTMIDEAYYYFNDKGILEAGGWLTHKDGRRFASPNGELMMGWQTVDGQMYYFDEQGILATGECSLDGNTYLFDKDGVPQTGWRETADGRRFYQEKGLMTVGTLRMEDGLRLFDESGYLMTDRGWASYLANKYYIDENGIVMTGVQVIDDVKYRFTDTGIYEPITICLDAGHYGKYNHSPVVSEYWESDFTWKIHLYLKEALEAYGIEVITTREDKDVDLGLETRGKTSKGCDLFLSLHSNACSSSSVDGPLACCAIDGSADELGLALANCVADVMETKQRGSIWKRVGDNGDYYGVIRGATSVGTPGILLEHSYHTNARATRWLLVDENVKRMAEAEAALLANWFEMTTGTQPAEDMETPPAPQVTE